MLDLVRIYLLVFGLITITGGVIGFVKAKSRASLIAGSVSGVLLLVAAYLTGTMGRPGLILGLIVSLALAARFAPKVRMSPRATVAGMMTALGTLGIGLTVFSLIGH